MRPSIETRRDYFRVGFVVADYVKTIGHFVSPCFAHHRNKYIRRKISGVTSRVSFTDGTYSGHFSFRHITFSPLSDRFRGRQ